MEQGTPGSTYGSGFWSGPIKVTTATMSDWPKAIDVKNDITKQGVATTFLRQMIAGMHSRGLYDVVSRKPPTVQSIVSYAGNAEGVDASTAQEFLDKVLSEKAALLRLLAAQLLTLVNTSSGSRS